MHDLAQAKSMAKALRRDLDSRGLKLSHSECLEIVARQLGAADWNTYAAGTGGKSEIQKHNLPAGWKLGGHGHENYRVGLDEAEPGSVRAQNLPHKPAHPDEFVTLMQSVQAGNYAGQRLRLKAELKAEDVVGAVTIWLRADLANGRTLIFDNLEPSTDQPPLQATTGWKERYIVLDIPGNTDSLHFGFFLRGNGRAWARRFQLEAAPDAQTTAAIHLENAPRNLDFRA